MQKHVNLVDLVKSFPTNIYLQNLASIQKRTSPTKFDHLAEKSDKDSISNLSTKAAAFVDIPVRAVKVAAPPRMSIALTTTFVVRAKQMNVMCAPFPHRTRTSSMNVRMLGARRFTCVARMAKSMIWTEAPAAYQYDLYA